ncbi:sodium/phosphate symporter [Haloarchaeobius sp. DYHT-AS-18]|uniref:sodium/phosphate symporter n=1 Tax=Haloarchaeobius sp. DYHT-AS-18 TaxID=3446117 RepID=UPI003EB941DB
MTKRRSYLLLALAVFSVGVAMRTLPLYWSPLPFNPDGIHWAALARETVAHGRVPTDPTLIAADEFAFATFFGSVSAVTGVPPLYVAQGMIAILGSVPALLAIAIVRRIGRVNSWPDRELRICAFLAGFALSVEGPFLRRSATVSSEVAGLLLVPILAISLDRFIRSRRNLWGWIAALLVALFPLIHNLSTTVAALTATAVVGVRARDKLSRSWITAVLLVLAFWVYLVLYYRTLGLAELSRVSGAPGLFIGWIVVLVLGLFWITTTTERLQRWVPSAVLGTWIILFGVNLFIPVFPGTMKTPPMVLLAVLLFSVPTLVASLNIHTVIRDMRHGPTLLALLVGAPTLVFFSLSAGLTPEYLATAIRAHTFVHFAVMACMGIGVANYLRAELEYSQLKITLCVVLFVGMLATAPIAFGGLQTFSYQATTTPAEFETATFAATTIPGTWYSDDHITRVTRNYYEKDLRGQPGSVTRVKSWLEGTEKAPACTTIGQHSWTTTGAQLYPAAAQAIGATEYESWLTERNVVYQAGSADPLVVVVPQEHNQSC